jgi:hypothetical protein
MKAAKWRMGLQTHCYRFCQEVHHLILMKVAKWRMGLQNHYFHFYRAVRW